MPKLEDLRTFQDAEQVEDGRKMYVRACVDACVLTCLGGSLSYPGASLEWFRRRFLVQARASAELF